MRPASHDAPSCSSLLPSRWGDAQARFYAATVAASDYADRVVPLLGGPWADLLDIGAGSGALGARLLAPGGRWTAVEPQAAMQGLLLQLKPALDARDIELQLEPCTWQTLPPATRAAGLLAANLGATHHQAADLFDAMAGRWRHGMRWVVAAQAGPSTFCLAGFLPAELHGADTHPAFERTLAQLGPARAPQHLEFVDWRCRYTFADLNSAQAHFLDRLELSGDTDQALDICRYVSRHAQPTSRGLEVSCDKRSAVLAWNHT